MLSVASTGIVRTPDDFGRMGQPPTHPELLDYLATELIRGGWSLKAATRRMVTTATYRMSSGEQTTPHSALRTPHSVDPDNRLVAAELERRWNEKLVQLRDLEMQLDQLNQAKQAPTLANEDRARLMTLGKDLVKAWNSAGVSIETRKKIIRLLVKEIIVDIVDDALALIIHWQGGDHSECPSGNILSVWNWL